MLYIHQPRDSLVGTARDILGRFRGLLNRGLRRRPIDYNVPSPPRSPLGLGKLPSTLCTEAWFPLSATHLFSVVSRIGNVEVYRRGGGKAFTPT